MKAPIKLLTLLLVLVMVFTLIPTVARAEEAAPEARFGSAEIPFRVNPMYEGIYEPAPEDIPQIPEPDMYSPQATTYQTLEQAIVTVRTNMKNRAETFTVYVKSTSSDYNAIFSALLNGAVEHTGVGNEGDYLMWHLGGWGGQVGYEISGGYYNYTYTFTLTYYTTAAQEQEMTTAVKNLINSLGVKNKSDYEKVCAVYDWMCANITYDYAHVNDSSYKLMFSAYAALVNKTAVCQGYAQLFYRLMLELGVDTRFIGGYGGGPHAWNIVQLGDYFYNVDSTWDAGYTDYYYFLKSAWTFGNHSRDPEFDYWEFHMEYPMAAEDYVHGGTATLDPFINMGYCGTEENDNANAAWAMMRDGTLLIEGDGAIYDCDTEAMPYWYYWIDHIEKAQIGEGITRVGNYCFYEATALKEVSLPDSLTEIGQYAFAGSGLESVEIPAGVAKLSVYSFQNCDALTSVTFHEGLTEIGDSAFEDCDALNGISFPATVTTIGYDTFASCDALTEVVVPETVTTMWDAFNGCTNLTKVVLNNRGRISTYAFTNCTKLTDVTIGPNITEIQGNAFSYCTSLKEITVPANVGDIFNFAFKGCSALETAYLNNTGTIDQYAFEDCTSLTEVYMTNVRSINQRAFENCDLRSVSIPASVQGIGTYAFLDNDNLKEIWFEGSAPFLDVNAFYSVTATAHYPVNNATWTDEVLQNYGGNITWLGYLIECDEHSYEAVVTKPTCTEQGCTTYTCTVCGESYADNYVDALGHEYRAGECIRCDAQDPAYANVVTSGWSGATQWILNEDGALIVYGSGKTKNYGYGGGQPWLAYADQITSVVIEEGVTEIGTGTFMNMPALETVTLPEKGLTKIGEASFYGCTALKEIEIPETIYTIWRYTFKGCSALESVKLPKSLIKIDQGAFENCTGLPAITIPTNVDIIGSWSFKGCTGLKKADMQWSDATEVREGAFKNCSSLTEIILPVNIQTLGDSCFYGIGATSFTVPETVTSVEAWCFARAYSLTEIIFEGNAPTIGEGAFNKITLTAYYPNGNATWTADIMQNYGGTVTWTAE